jgi:hypothetical protein
MTTYRYKFSEQFQKHLVDFSTINKWCEPKQFKENWEKWISENNTIIQPEIRRLETLGYKGDALKKMYTSVRYYFKNKNCENVEPKKRNKYNRIDPAILQLMDMHIKRFDRKPSEGFDDFQKIYSMGPIKDKLEDKIGKNEYTKKFKKTYKNRYFMNNK